MIPVSLAYPGVVQRSPGIMWITWTVTCKVPHECRVLIIPSSGQGEWSLTPGTCSHRKNSAMSPFLSQNAFLCLPFTYLDPTSDPLSRLKPETTPSPGMGSLTLLITSATSLVESRVCVEWSPMTRDVSSRHSGCLPAQGLTGTVRTSLTPRREAHCAALGGLWQGPLAQKNKETLQEQSTSKPADLASNLCFFTF